ALHHAREKHEILTGLLYIDNESIELNELLNTTQTPLNLLTEKELCPGSAVLDKICAELR
nr:2-oxoacid:ferredoxin oxidoreductase subunit beta [Saprospiraceae bacterium]